jgi:ribosomal protein S18 acetylase RimI-like enzyme
LLCYFYDNCYDFYLLEFVMIRSTTPADTNALMALVEALGLFEPSQIAELAAMLAEHFAGDSPDYWLMDEDQVPVGVAYVAPERMTEGTWNLYLIAVHPERQRQGRGKKLLEYVERLLIDRGERVLLVETAGTEDFEYVRAFYRRSGFTEEARIRDFYAAGVDKVIYLKFLQKPRA